MINNNVCAVILAGGLSSRMKEKNKTLKKINNKVIFDIILNNIQSQVDKIIINSNSEEKIFIKYNLKVISDNLKGFLGPLAGIHASLNWLIKNDKEVNWLVTIPCDTPFLPKNLIDVLLKEAIRGKHKIVIATSKEKTHPTIGIWHLSLFNDLDSSIKKGVRKILQWASRHSLGYVEFKNSEYDPFFNINYKEDILKAEEIENNFIK